MANLLKIARSHPNLAWLSGLKRAHTVPSHVASQMSNLRSHEEAQAYVRSAGLHVQTASRQKSRTANAVTVILPDSPGLNRYYDPQIVITKTGCERVPFGTALINCLIPKTKTLSEAEALFQKFQAVVLAFSKRLEALPFACITGHVIEDPEHDLAARGFRFFFSPNPDPLFNRISTKLEKALTLNRLAGSKNADRDECRRLALEIHEMQWHSVLDDVTFYLSQTELVDLSE